MMRLVNRYEKIAYDEIKMVAERWGLSVYPKVRVADVISLDQVAAVGDLRRYGLQSHFDFVICRDEWDPIYAIEFDGRYHSTPQQMARDAKKDELCRRDGFPILRINSRHLTHDFGRLSLVAWIMDVYELQEGFHAAQARGEFPDDEPFDPLLIAKTGIDEEWFPYWISAKPLVKLRKLHELGSIIDPVSSGFIGHDTNNVLKGIEYIRVTETDYILVRSAMRPQLFPIALSDLFGEILLVQLAERVFMWLRGEVKAMPMDQVDAMICATREGLELVESHSFNRGSRQGNSG